MGSRTWLLSLILFQFLFVSLLALQNRPGCVHEQKQADFESVEIEYVRNSPEDNNYRALQNHQTIRVLFDYSQLTVEETLKDYLMNELMPPIQNYLQATLRVNQNYDLFRVSNTVTEICSGEVTLPLEYSDPGVQADLVIFITSAESADYVAYSRICMVDPITSRPIAGQLVISTLYIKPTESKAEREYDTVTLIHEITHILGFSPSIYSRFIDPTTGAKLTNHILKKTVYGISSTVLNLAPLTERLQNYFGCDTIAGAYLENQGSSSSLGAHFERRIFGNEFMTASRIADARMTEFTLALLEGTGWYVPDYTMAEAMTYGKGKGCSFITGECMDKTTLKANFEEFCSPLMQVGCSWTARGGAACGAFNQNTNSALKSGINWWGNQTVMFDNYADNCPTYQLYGNTDCEDINDESAARVSGSFYGYGRKCFKGTLSNKQSALSFGSYCFKSSCNTEDDGSMSIAVKIGSKTVTCQKQGDISVSGMSGKLSCPDPATFCSRTQVEGYCRRGCMGRGSCVDKECECIGGWSSFDCSIPTYTDKCERCAGLDPWKTSCYADTCVCNPHNGTCMGIVAKASNKSLAHIGIIVGVVVGTAAFAMLGFIVAVKRGKIVLKRKKPAEIRNTEAEPVVVQNARNDKEKAKEGSSTTSLPEKENSTTQTGVGSKNSKVDLEKIGSRYVEGGGEPVVEAGVPTLILSSPVVVVSKASQVDNEGVNLPL